MSSKALQQIPLRQIIRSELQRAADPVKARGMQAYMKSAMPYFGVPTIPLRRICKRVFDAHLLPDKDAWQSQCLAIWRGARRREEWYAAIELTGHRFYRAYQTRQTLPMYEEMIVTGAWWDVVDTIASHCLGDLLRADPAFLRKKMLQWSRSRNLWKRRSSILCQLSFKAETDLPLLYACIEPSLDSNEFFLRKAIGWALRQYVWTDSREVQRYVSEHADRLSPLSKREALKNIGG
ncbi:MAG TPA: DNA alkylation repair protein [Bryobacteraceae bacterium]|nr:DNA alkylation repair protein [Bryobacteraceae bacterium]